MNLALLGCCSVLAVLPPTVPPADRGTAQRGTLAITNVNVVPMSRDTVITNTTVLVRDGRIAAVGPTVAIPAGATVIDGRGRFLIPGLTDMHVHLFADDSAVHDSAGPAELGVMIATGVTAARFMIGTPQHLTLRQQVAAGEIVGPQLWVASPQVTGEDGEHTLVARTADEAHAAVRRAAQDGYDFVKLTNSISRVVYDAVIDEGRTSGIRIVGHVDRAVGVRRALETGQQLEHLDGFFEAVLADSAPATTSVTQGGLFSRAGWATLDHVDDRKVAEIAAATGRAGAFVGPTQHVFNHAFGTGWTDSVIRSWPDWQLWPVAKRDLYLRARARYWSAAAAEFRTPERLRRYVAVRNALVKGIQESGGKILAGSDAPEWFNTYGWGLHRELEALVAAGLTPYQALAAATRNPAAFLGATQHWGTIEPGKRADLVVLAANPLTDIRNTLRIEAVVVGGRHFGKDALDAMVQRAARAINPMAAAQQPTGHPAVDSAAVARAAWREAAGATDLPTAYRAVTRAATAWPVQPAYVAGRARLAARLDDDTSLAAALRSLFGMGAGAALATDTAVVRRAAANAAVGNARADLERATAPLRASTVYRTLPDSTVFAEGLDADPATLAVFVGSVRQRTIFEVGPNGTVRDLGLARHPGIGAILGVRYDAKRRVLWATTAGLPQMRDFAAGDTAIAALLQIRVADGVIERRWDLPAEPAGHTAGDLAIGPAGDVWVTDSRAPVLYRLRPGADTLERLTHRLFRSLQGVATAPDGSLYVADYSHGLLRVHPQTRTVVRLIDAAGTTSLGLDGIVWHRGAIVAVQNGVAPPRIARFELDATGMRIGSVRVLDRALPLADEPTIGALIGDEFIYVANSQWEKYDESGRRVAGTLLAPTVVLRLPLQK